MEGATGFSKSSAKLYAAAILGVAMVAAAGIVARTFYQVKALDSTLSVTGSAKQQVTSDQVKWVGQFNRNAPAFDLRAGYVALKRDETVVREFLKAQGIADDERTISSVFVEAPFRYDPQAPQQFDLHQTVEVRSSDVTKITDLAKNLQPLVDKEVVFVTQSLEYYYSKLPELRVNLLSAAVDDAKARADKIAGSTKLTASPHQLGQHGRGAGAPAEFDRGF